jgi:V8-like Glu-specific endopeptidase
MSRRAVLALGGCCVLLLAALAAGAQTRVRVGEERPYSANLGAYPAGAPDRPVVWSETIHSSGATFIRVHFKKFQLPEGDYLTVSSPDGTDFWTYTAKGVNGTGEFWSFMVESDTAIVELHAGPALKARGRRYGVVVDRIAHGFLSPDVEPGPAEKVICSTNGEENVACHATVNVAPVARISFQSGGSSFVCTSWLVAGSNPNTALTNNHCVSTQAEVSTVQARFNFQTTTCTGTTTATTSTFAGGTFLKTSSVTGGLDYTLYTLQGNPEATFGEYTATSKAPTTGLSINVIQHPGGRVKQIGFWANSGHTTRCTLSTINQTYGGSATGTQTGYSCDTEGGSSGSAVMDAGTGRIIALHHFGGVTSSPCLNSGTQMRQICANAGSLLSCATN